MSKKYFGSRITPTTISITFDDGNPVVISSDNINFSKIKDKILKKDFEGLFDLCNPGAGIKTYLNGRAQIKGGTIFVDNEPVDGAIVPIILTMIRDGGNADHLLRFVELLHKNPSMNSRRQLWDFCAKNDVVIYSGAPVTVRDKATGRTSTIDATGYLVLYKGVNANYTDCHTGRFDNTPGNQLSMLRSKVDDNQNAGCSSGFHAGAFPYVQSFGTRKLIVLVSPEDVGSVPNDCSYQKLRTCKYTVLKEVEAATFAKIESSVYKDDGKVDYAVQFRRTKTGKLEQEIVKAIDVAHANEIVQEEFNPAVIVNVFLKANAGKAPA